MIILDCGGKLLILYILSDFLHVNKQLNSLNCALMVTQGNHREINVYKVLMTLRIWIDRFVLSNESIPVFLSRGVLLGKEHHPHCRNCTDLGVTTHTFSSSLFQAIIKHCACILFTKYNHLLAAYRKAMLLKQ